MILPIPVLFGRHGGSTGSGGVPSRLTAALTLPAGSGSPTGGWSDADHAGGAGSSDSAASDSSPAESGAGVNSDSRPGLTLHAGYPAWSGDRRRLARGVRSSGGRDRWQSCGIAGLADGWDETVQYLMRKGGDVAEDLSVRQGVLVQRGPTGELIYAQPAGNTSNLPVAAGMVDLRAAASANSGGAALLIGAVVVVGVVVLVVATRGRR